VTPGLLQDALQKNIVNFIDISKRLKVNLRAGGALDHFTYRELMTLYEQGYFPIWKNLNLRFWSYVCKVFCRKKTFIPKDGRARNTERHGDRHRLPRLPS
jgi:hypothetical protein